ncbi:MAG: spermidine synthase [Rhizobiaceae bacterium]|nr:spermidine synthase [Rhizobiaceae bacterium]MCV0408324.1 spermidine synthase [Rhizobiaceae bacterium]
MGRLLEELDYRPTPIGALSLRRRREARLDVDVIEIKLGDEHLMSDLFTESEVALGRLGIEAAAGPKLDVVVGGLGLGYTARAVLESARVAELMVVEYLAPVVEWHSTGLLPLGAELSADRRCRIVQADFFALAADEAGLDPDKPGRHFDAVLVDIDHSPDALLDGASAGFYTTDGLHTLSRHLVDDGVFGLWSNDGPDEVFVARLQAAFGAAWAEPVRFANPYNGETVTQTIYLARRTAR